MEYVEIVIANSFDRIGEELKELRGFAIGMLCDRENSSKNPDSTLEGKVKEHDGFNRILTMVTRGILNNYRELLDRVGQIERIKVFQQRKRLHFFLDVFLDPNHGFIGEFLLNLERPIQERYKQTLLDFVTDFKEIRINFIDEKLGESFHEMYILVKNGPYEDQSIIEHVIVSYWNQEITELAMKLLCQHIPEEVFLQQNCGGGGMTPVSFVALNDDDNLLDLLTMMVPRSAFTQLCDCGSSALFFAVKIDSTKCLQSLLRHITDESYFFKPNKNGETIVYCAAEHGAIECLEMLFSIVKDFCETPFLDLLNMVTNDNQQNPLFIAARNGHTECVAFLLEHGCDNYRETVDSRDRTPLYMAAKKGHVESVNLLLKDSKTEYREKGDDGGMTPLYIACCLNNVECVKALMEGSRPGYLEIPNLAGFASLAASVTQGSLECLKFLLDGKDVMYKEQIDSNGQTLLHAAAQASQTEVIEFLLKDSRPGFREVQDKNGHTALHVAAGKEYGADCLRLLLQDSSPEYREILDNTRFTALYWAAMAGFPDSIRILLEGANPEYRYICCEERISPLYIASMCGHVECVKVLLEGARPDYRELASCNDATPLVIAAKYNHTDCMKVLLEGTDQKYREICNDASNSALYFAAIQGHAEAIEVLLKGSRHQFREISDYNNMTPLVAAAAKNHPECVKALLKDAKPTYHLMKDDWGHTALDWARKLGNKDCIDVLSTLSGPRTTTQSLKKKQKQKKKSPEILVKSELLPNLIIAMTQIKEMKYEDGTKTIISSISTCPPEVKSELLEATNPTLEEHVKSCFNALKSGKCEITLALADVGLWLFDTHEEKFVFHLIKAKVNRRMRDFDFAHQDCLNCLSLNKNCADAHFEIGMNYMLEEEMKEAEKAFKKCLKIDKNHQHGMNALKKIQSK